jgi:deoxyadenosine/deoxycytidine kinase
VAEPVLVVYLEGSAQVCLDRITKRNRPYEQKIELDSLKSFIEDYENLFAGWTKSPVIRLDVQDFNCLQDEDVKNLAKEIESYIWKSPPQ